MDFHGIIEGHDSEDKAYVVTDYPYGFRLRCQIRYWIETSKTQGDRFCSQTSNPKRPGLVWNKPKKSTYMAVMIMGFDSKGHVTYTGISKGWSNLEAIAEFEALAGAGYSFNSYQKSMIAVCKAIQKAQKHIKIEIVGTTNETPEDREAREAKQAEVKKDLAGIFGHYLGEEKAKAGI